MKRNGLLPWRLMGAAAAVAALVMWRAAASACQHRRLLRHGEIHALEDLWLDVNACRIYARCATAAGKAGRMPVVLVHGWGVSSSYFVPLAERLATEFCVYAPDLPGHGRSDTPDEPLDIPGLAQALVAWMDAAGLERAVLVGQSMGCQVVTEIALRHSQRAARLVLIGLTRDPEATLLKHCGRLLADGVYEHASLYWHLLKDYFRMGHRLLPELQAMMRDPIDQKLSCVTVPTMLVRGENDTIVPPRWFSQAASLLNTSHATVIPRWGHAVQYSAPEAVADAIRPFLR